MKTERISSAYLGVDLIELKKAKSFYRACKKRLSSFFSDTEIGYIRRSKKPHESFAILLAAKEAAFKALSQPGVGIAAFRNIEILPRLKGKLTLRFKQTRRRKSIKFSVLKNRRVVIVQCAGI
jgi:phosphopantetheine--protein transferase-like protein